MKLYHGSLTEVRVPHILTTEHIGDFGPGFYTTTDLEQARKFAAIKCARNRKNEGVVSCFEVSDNLLQHKELRVQIFREADEAWVNFVEANRRQPNFRHNFDIVYGPVANDQVYASFALYENDLIDFDELLKRLKVRKLTDQLLLHTRKALAELRYMGSEVVSCQQK